MKKMKRISLGNGKQLNGLKFAAFLKQAIKTLMWSRFMQKSADLFAWETLFGLN